ncbi:MAG: hypothetical protein ONA69_01205 [candidate division KSB1 bacterium]|nr:hypothetical protein [candidate division KSB1 bacterium]
MNDLYFSKQADLSEVPYDTRLQLLDQIFQGQLANIPADDLARLIYLIQSLGSTMPGGIQSLTNLITQGGQLAQQAGLPREMTIPASLGSAAWASSWYGQAGPQGFSGLSPDEAVLLDQRLRLMAASSPMANILGATLALYESNLINKGSVGEEIVKTILARRFRTPSGISLGRLPPAEWVRLMAESGVPPPVAWNQIQSQSANWPIIFRYGLSDFVRAAQRRFDVEPTLNNLFSRSISRLAPLLHAEVPNRPDLPAKLSYWLVDRLLYGDPKVLSATAGDMVDELVRDVVRDFPDLQNNKNTMNVVRSAFHMALSSADHTIRNDDRYRAYRSLPSFISMHRPDLMQSTEAARAAADREAMFRRKTMHVGRDTFLQRLTGALQDEADSRIKIPGRENLSSVGRVTMRAMGARPLWSLFPGRIPEIPNSAVNQPPFLPPEPPNPGVFFGTTFLGAPNNQSIGPAPPILQPPSPMQPPVPPGASASSPIPPASRSVNKSP